MEYQIGEFSCITRLTVKTLRFYHEEGLLLPSRIDNFTGYRYYNRLSIERAQLIATLRSFDFSIEEIKQILAHCTEDEDLGTMLEQKSQQIRLSVKALQAKQRRLTQVIHFIEEQKNMNANQDLTIKDYGAELVATIRYTGTYQEIGQYFAKLFRAAGPQMAGKPFALYHDREFRETDADIEAGLPLQSAIDAAGITCKTLPAGQYLVVVHRGPYETLSASYEKLTSRLTTLGLKPNGPIREVYLKGPGMIFRGNPRNYLTEIRLPVAPRSGTTSAD